MTHILKYISMAMIVANPIMAFLVIYGGGSWLSAVNFVILTITWVIIYRGNVELIETEKLRNARIKEMMDDYRS